MMRLIPQLKELPASPDAYGIHYDAEERCWDAVLNGEIIARRATATDAEAVLIGIEDGGQFPTVDPFFGSDYFLGTPAIERKECEIPERLILFTIAVLTLLVMGGVGALVYGIVTHAR